MKEKLEKIRDTLEHSENVTNDILDKAGQNGTRTLKATEVLSMNIELKASIALIDSILAERDSPWRLIGTAPKDGTEILGAYVDWNKDFRIAHSKFDVANKVWRDLGSMYRAGDGMIPGVKLDYWMPLPKQP